MPKRRTRQELLGDVWDELDRALANVRLAQELAGKVRDRPHWLTGQLQRAGWAVAAARDYVQTCQDGTDKGEAQPPDYTGAN
jgi:hypothetical protein